MFCWVWACSTCQMCILDIFQCFSLIFISFEMGSSQILCVLCLGGKGFADVASNESRWGRTQQLPSTSLQGHWSDQQNERESPRLQENHHDFFLTKRWACWFLWPLQPLPACKLVIPVLLAIDAGRFIRRKDFCRYCESMTKKKRCFY